MKNIIKSSTILFPFVLIIFIISGCANNNASESDFISGSEIDFKDTNALYKSFDSLAKVKINLLTEKGISPVDQSCADVPLKREDLTGMRTVVKIYEGSNSAGLTIPGFGGLTLGKDEASLNVYYIETKKVRCDTITKIFGIGYSVHFLIKKIKRNLSITNLPVLAASVQLENKKTDVYYSIQSYGIIGNAVAVFFKPVVNEQFDVKGFGVMQSSIDGIHNSITNDSIANHLKFTPEELSNIKIEDLK